MTTIVSLSTIPTRFDGIYPVLESILAQDLPIDEVRLYVPRNFRRFPDYDGSLPNVPEGVRILQPEDDLGPASKILFVARDLRGQDCDIFFCDDDMLFEPDQFRKMLEAREGRKDHCVTAQAGFILQDGKKMQPARKPVAKRNPKDFRYRLKRLGQFWREWRTGVKEEKPYHPDIIEPGYVHIAQGYGGVLVRPEFFDDEMYDIPPVLWTVDDYWLSGHFERKGVPIWGAAGLRKPKATESRDVSALYSSIVDGSARDDANNACIKYMQDTYGIWKF